MSQAAHSALVVALLQERPTPGIVVRIARTAAGWSQAELGRRCGYSASQISRWETGRLPLRDVGMLRILAEVLGLPPEVFGLTDGHTTKALSRSVSRPSHKVGQIGTSIQKEDDPVRRRTFLLAAGLAGSSLALPRPALAALSGKADPAELLASQLAGVLVGPPPATESVAISVLREALAAAQGEFLACRYVPLATGLPALIATAETAAAERAHPAAHQVLAKTNNLATRALIKLQASGLEWISADRALHAARAAEDALTLAES
ncbi:MAG: helix-turn-helix domain-containing protein, partial [Egibacteraceae bacterium]